LKPVAAGWGGAKGSTLERAAFLTPKFTTQSEQYRYSEYKLDQVVKVIWHKPASPPHMDGSVVFARWQQYAPHIQKAKNGCHDIVPYMCKVSAISAFCRPTTQPPSITNCLVAIVLTNPVIVI